MTQFQAVTPDIEVNGQTVIAFIAGMEHYQHRALEILERNGIANPRPGEWYSQQAWLNAFKTIAEEVGPYTLYCIGTKIPEHAQFPDGIDSLESALRSIDIAYHLNHRGGEIGSYQFHHSPDGTMHFFCDNPYPCEFDRGIIEGMARRFEPPGRHINVRHDDSAPCRNRGDDSCRYRIELSP